MDINAFFTELEKLLKEEGLETYLMPGTEVQIGNTLRAMVPVTEAGNAVLLEVMAVPLTEDAHLLQIYSTIIAEISSGYDLLKEAVLDWNLTCPLGAFGIYKPLKQLYHKYNYLMTVEVPPDEMADEIFYIIDLLRDVIAQVLPDAVRLSGNL